EDRRVALHVAAVVVRLLSRHVGARCWRGTAVLLVARLHPDRRCPRASPEAQILLHGLRGLDVRNQFGLVAVERELGERRIGRGTVRLRAVRRGVGALNVLGRVANLGVVAGADWNATPSEVRTVRSAEQQANGLVLHISGTQVLPTELVEGGAHAFPLLGGGRVIDGDGRGGRRISQGACLPVST